MAWFGRSRWKWDTYLRSLATREKSSQICLHGPHLHSGVWLTRDNFPTSFPVDFIDEDHVGFSFAAADGAAGLVPGEVRSFAFCGLES